MRYSSKSGVFAVAVLLSGAAVLGSACGGSGSDDRGSPSAGAPAVTAGAPGSSGASASAGAGGGSSACDSATMCCATTTCTCPYPQGAAASPVIANMEDGTVKFNTATLMTKGYWDFSRDASMGTVTPAGNPTLMAVDGGANGTTKAMHVKGENLTGWGAALAAELSNGCPFDASSYGGISFYAKGTSTVLEGANKLLVLVGNPEYIPKTSGGFCDEAAKDPNCYARHRVTIDLTPEWKQYIIAWDDLKAPGYLTTGKPFGSNRVRDIVFNASGPSPDPMPAASFDFWVDELKFEPAGVKGNVMTTTGSAGAGAGGGSSMGGAGGAGGASAGAGGAAAGAGGASAGAGGAAAGAGGA